MKIIILQQKNPTFRVLKNQKFNKKDYKKVYQTTVTKFAGNPGIEHKVLLEMLFERFNRGNYPEDYKGHSMSVGDIVMLDDFVYVCATVGWKEIEWEQGDSDYENLRKARNYIREAMIALSNAWNVSPDEELQDFIHEKCMELQDEEEKLISRISAGGNKKDEN